MMPGSPLSRSLKANKPVDQPLSKSERQVIYTLYSTSKGEKPDAQTRDLILRIANETPAQWTETAKQHPDLVAAIHSYLYGNLIERT
jgi:hypothetical protein